MRIHWSDTRLEEPWADALADEDLSTAFEWLPGRFCLFYQPEQDLQSGALAACEALLRWWHPEYGMLQPDASLRGTRWTDRIAEIEAWAVRTAFQQASRWSREVGPIQVAVNVSQHLLESERFLPLIDEAVDAAAVDPRHLAIDVPIGALAMEPLRLAAVTDGIVERGLDVIIDGVGEAAEHYAFERVDAAVWKIDLWARARRRPGVHPSVTAALARAHDAGVVTVAKAVEDAETLAAVGDLGFDRAFGHAVSPAVTPSAMEALLRRPRRDALG